MEQQKAIRLTKKMQLNFIESEISNYCYHAAMSQKIQEKIDELESVYYARLNCPLKSSSIIKVPEGNSTNSNWIVNMKGEIAFYEEKRDAELKHVELVDLWLSDIPFEQKHLEVIELFLKKGMDASVVSDMVGYTEANVRKIRERSLEKIYSRFF